MVNGRFLSLIVASVSLLFSASSVAGPGDLLVSPVRVVFEGRDRVAEVTLVNKSSTMAEYRIDFENRRMLEDGSFEPIETEEDGVLFAESFVRFAPRRVTLAPNTPQTIRLMLRTPEGLADGEYRSHLRFAAIPDDGGQNSVERTRGNTSDLSIELIPIYGVTIPVIVRQGELSAAASFEAPEVVSLTDDTFAVRAALHRVGDKSLYGDVALHVKGNDEAIVTLRGIAVYTPNDTRRMDIEVPKAELKSVTSKALELRFIDRATGDVLTASSEFSLTP